MMNKAMRQRPDERIQKAWSQLSAKFYFVLAAAQLAMLGLKLALCDSWKAATPEIVALAIGALVTVIYLTAAHAWTGRDEAVTSFRNLTLHTAYFLTNWAAFAGLFVGRMIDKGNGGMHSLGLIVLAAVYITRRIMASRQGLILYRTEAERAAGDRKMLLGAIVLGVLYFGVVLAGSAIIGVFGWVAALIGAALGALTGWGYWRYYRWLLRRSERAADAQLAAAEGSDEE